MKIQRFAHILSFCALCFAGIVTILVAQMFETFVLPGVSKTIFTIILLVFISYIVGYALSWIMMKRVSRPLHNIVTMVQNIKEGASYLEELRDNSNTLWEIKKTSDALRTLAEKAVKDISEMKRLERVRSEFLGNVSHELRTPIFSIQGYLETLLDGALDDETVSRQFVQRAYSNAERLNILLGDLIDISKIESGEMRLSFRYFTLADTLKDTVHSLEYEAHQRNVSLFLETSGINGLTVFGDKERIIQVVTNLLQNAIKYNVEGGKVTVEATAKEKEIIVKVKDTGIGIPQQHLPRIFERFYRVDKDRSRAVGGTGLGLAIVKHILEAHQASFGAESEVGNGTTIWFSLKR